MSYKENDLPQRTIKIVMRSLNSLRDYQAEELPFEKEIRTKSDYQYLRAKGDLCALEKKWHNRQLHMQLQPIHNMRAKEIFTAVEKARIALIGLYYMPGIAKNLDFLMKQNWQTFYKKHKDAIHQEQTLDQAIPLFFRKALSPTKFPRKILSYFSEEFKTIEGFISELPNNYLNNLKASLYDQKSFAQKIYIFLQQLCLIKEEELPTVFRSESQKITKNQNSILSEEDIIKPKIEEKNDTGNNSAGKTQESPINTEEEKETCQIEEEENYTLQAEHRPQSSLKQKSFATSQKSFKQGDSPSFSHLLEKNYRIYCRDFDKILKAKELMLLSSSPYARKNFLQDYENYKTIAGRLAHRLQRQLLAQQRRGFIFDLEEGLLDTSRLSRIVTGADRSLSFKKETHSNFRDTIVTLLIDNSGSMRGRPIRLAALCAYILSQTLERCNVKTEILGFTTLEWKGGKSRQKWVQEGRPKNPGRLNDLCHIIYKDAQTTTRHAQKALEKMEEDSLLKENIDGEALLWAASRLKARPEARKILLILSDGAPVDDSTLCVNPANYLEAHLQTVIEEIEKKTDIELIALGIGHDVTRYYRQAIYIKNSDQLADVMMQEFIKLFAPKNTKTRRYSFK